MKPPDVEQWLDVFSDIGVRLSSSAPDLDKILSSVLSSAERLLQVSNAVFYILNEKSLPVEALALLKESKTVAERNATVQRVAKNNRAEIQNKTIAVPVCSGGRVKGVLEVSGKKTGEPFEKEDLRYSEILANQISILLQCAHEERWLPDALDFSQETEKKNALSKIVWQDPLFGKVLEKTDRIAKTHSPVLILGESGTGKELIADRIHALSNRSKAPMIKLNCAAIPQNLLESELFGHVKGAFTDAFSDKPGCFKRADGGTLLLDEIGDFSPLAQAKVLRVLQDGGYQPLGSETYNFSDVRILAATNKNLEDSVKKGLFREDLYYRLSVFKIEIPPLRERPGDIEALSRYLLKETRKSYPEGASDFTFEALEVLISCEWIGNVRELGNIIERSVVNNLGKGVISSEDLAIDARTDRGGGGTMNSSTTLREAVKRFKRNYIRDALQKCGNNQTRASAILGVQRTYLSRLISSLDISIK